MHPIEIIQKKRDKGHLSKEEINFLLNSYMNESMTDYQMAAFLMATCINGMSEQEISWFTAAMIDSGEVINHEQGDSAIIDKHSTGGVGDKISIPLAPAVAACGIRVPMIAGRGLGHTGGTLDKLEAIPGIRCDLSVEQYKRQVSEIGCVIMGQTKEIAPLDKKLYALRDVTGTVESIALISSSIMSKKMAEGIDGLVLDVKFGSGAFMKEIEKARALAKTMVKIGSHMGKKVAALLTNMDQPIGQAVGNALEIEESIEILRGNGPSDSVLLTTELGAEMLMLAGTVKTLEEGRTTIKQALSSGAALEKFAQMVKAQGGDVRCVYEPHRLNISKETIVIEAPHQGFIKSIDSMAIGVASGLLGGGRFKLSDKINHSVGIKMNARVGDKVEKGQPLCTLFIDRQGVDEASIRVENAFSIVEHETNKPALFYDRITSIHAGNT